MLKFKSSVNIVKIGDKMKNTTAIIYCRVSTGGQAKEGLSLDAQKTRCEAYCISQGYKIIDTVIDDGYSAKDMNRPGFKKILSKLKNGKASILVFFKLDRLTRSVKDLASILETMEETGFQLASISESLDTSTASGRMMLNLITTVAQWEREVISERTKEVLDHKKCKGEKTGGKRQYGYDIEDRDGKKIAVPNNAEQKKIKLMKKLREDGLSLPAICKELRRRKIKTVEGSTTWQPMTVSRILQRELEKVLSK